jgi:hypothetical protein
MDMLFGEMDGGAISSKTTSKTDNHLHLTTSPIGVLIPSFHTSLVGDPHRHLTPVTF